MNKDPYQSLMASAFRYLSIRQRSKKEIREFLEKKATKGDFSLEKVDEVLGRLEEMEYINDTKFAQMYVSSALVGKPKGPATIRFELKQKGVSDEIIQSILSQQEEIHDPDSQIRLARKALGKKGEQYKKLPILECKRKVHDYLLRRGFSAGTTRQLVDDYCVKSYNKNHEIS